MTYLKIVLATQADILRFRYVERKLYNCSTNIYCNQECFWCNLTPKCASIKLASTSGASEFTGGEITLMRIKDEIKFLYIKKSTAK